MIWKTVSSVTGLTEVQSAMNPAGIQAESIRKLFDLFLYVSIAVFLFVILFLLISVLRLRRSASDSERQVLIDDPDRQKRMKISVSTALGLTVLILFGLLITDFSTGRSIYSSPKDKPLKIEVTGRQWWWEVTYNDPTPSHRVTTANEIHIPVGKTVQFQLVSPDVIHSFWAPNFHGKKDMIPGHPTTTWLRADKAGEYRGQCAEFCGYQHAHMRLVIIAESQVDFEAWRNAQLMSSVQPVNESQRKGQAIFLSKQCVMCHTILGTGAAATVGPDLTHFASRKMIASGTLPNTRNHLAEWVLDPQKIKPGVKMPANPLSSAELNSLLDYLQILR
jgi:cytochrome c oxidase subunit 2